MKKFITYVSMQNEASLKLVNYEAMDGFKIDTSRMVHFPVSLLIDNFTENDEEIELICIKEEENADIERNFGVLCDEINSIVSERGAKCSFNEVPTSKYESSESHLKLFADLIERINDGDRVYACATFGTKPIPIVEMMALDYAYRVKNEVIIENIVYGKIDRSKTPLEGSIYDISPLFFMQQIVAGLADQKVSKPETIIKKILNMGE